MTKPIFCKTVLKKMQYEIGEKKDHFPTTIKGSRKSHEPKKHQDKMSWDWSLNYQNSVYLCLKYMMIKMVNWVGKRWTSYQ